MRVIKGWDRGGERVLALGTFDGVHLGHRALLRRARMLADRVGCPLRVCTFDRHPLSVISPEKAPLLLTTAGEKAEKLAEAGADEMQVIPFSPAVASLTPDAFLGKLEEGIRIRGLAAGWNYTFGKDGAGNGETLIREGKERGFEVLIEAPFRQDGEPVSSSRIRRALEDGNVKQANDLLGAPYMISGMLTENSSASACRGELTMHLPQDKQLPAPGAYAGLIPAGKNGMLQALVYFGEKPASAETAAVCFVNRAHLFQGSAVRLLLLGKLHGPETPETPEAVRRMRDIDLKAAEKRFMEGIKADCMQAPESREHGKDGQK